MENFKLLITEIICLITIYYTKINYLILINGPTIKPRMIPIYSPKDIINAESFFSFLKHLLAAKAFNCTNTYPQVKEVNTKSGTKNYNDPKNG